MIGSMVFYNLERTQYIAKGYTHRNSSYILNKVLQNTSNYAQDIDLINDIIELLKSNQENESDCRTSEFTNFGHAIYFATSVITTIGYGNITPKTEWGQILCIPYALFGIPLTLTFLITFGTFLNKLIENQIINQLFHHKSKNYRKGLTIVLLMILGSIIFLFIPAVVFSYTEKWKYSTSIYYSVMSLSTIGFGDYVICSESIAYRIFLISWIWIGLSWFSTLVSAMQRHFTNFSKKKIRKLSLISQNNLPKF